VKAGAPTIGCREPTGPIAFDGQMFDWGCAGFGQLTLNRNVKRRQALRAAGAGFVGALTSTRPAPATSPACRRVGLRNSEFHFPSRAALV
jgi:hypothetical protein